MAFNILDTSYSGTYASHFIQRATFGMDTIEKGLVNVKSDIGKMHTIPRIDYKRPFKPRMAVPTTDNLNPFTLDGRMLIPKSVDVYEEFNPRDLEENQLAEALKTQILDRDVPATLENQMLNLVMTRAGEQYEIGLWMGSLSYAGFVTATDDRYQIQYFDGFMKRMVNDPLVNLSSISPVTITVANIATIMNDLISQVTIKNRGMISNKKAFQNLKYIMSPKTGTIFSEYLTTGTTFKGQALDFGLLPRWRGYKVEIAAGFPDDTILMCNATDDEDSNLWAGMNSMQDWDLKIGKTLPQNETFFIQGKWKFDTNYGWSEEIFLYTTLTPANFLP